VLGAFRPQLPLTFNIGDLKFRDGSFWSWLWWNQTSKYSYDVISVTSSPLRHWRHQNNVTKIFPIWAFLNQNFWLCQWSWVNNLMVFKKESWFWKNRWSWSCNLVVLLHHWFQYIQLTPENNPYFATCPKWHKNQSCPCPWEIRL